MKPLSVFRVFSDSDRTNDSYNRSIKTITNETQESNVLELEMKFYKHLIKEIIDEFVEIFKNISDPDRSKKLSKISNDFSETNPYQRYNVETYQH